jgi:hypothetical protein
MCNTPPSRRRFFGSRLAPMALTALTRLSVEPAKAFTSWLVKGTAFEKGQNHAWPRWTSKPALRMRPI